MHKTVGGESETMGSIVKDGLDGTAAAKKWMAAHPEVVQKWLASVNTFDGGDAVAAVNAALRS